MTRSHIIVCLKWNVFDAPDGAVTDERFAGIALADQAALELGLRTADTTRSELAVVCAGPPSADKILREALACGAHRALRVDIAADSSSIDAARAVTHALETLDDIALIWCGDYSSDRGSGSFPAFLAALTGLEQMLGLVAVDISADGGTSLDVVRRLDGGRRERSRVHGRAVLSVEGSVARLRRAPLSNAITARSQPIDVVDFEVAPVETPVFRPFRPRARVMAAPSGDSPLERIRAVTESAAPKGSSEPVSLEPSAAAEMILERLRSWGYIS